MHRSEEDRKRPRRGQRPDPAVRTRAEALASTGIPMQMAMAVAGGRLALNEALERLARRDAVNRLMEKHQISRALATQIALGQASLDAVLSTRRLQEHRDTNRDRSVLDIHFANGEPLTLLLHGHRRVSGRIVGLDPYMVRLQPDEGEIVEFHKLQIKLAFVPDAYKRVRKILKYDKALEAAPKDPITKPQDRYTCSDRRLFRYIDEKPEIHVTLLEGEQIRGHVAWFSRFEFGLRLKGDAEAIVFRHAIQDIVE